MKIRRLLPLLLLAACTGDPSGIDTGDVRMTVAVSDEVPPQNNVTVQVRNEGDHTIYVANSCGNIIATGIERRSGGGWVPAPYGYVCFAAYTPPIALAPGETVTGAIAIDEPGLYRSTVRIGTAPEEGDFAPVRKEFAISE